MNAALPPRARLRRGKMRSQALLFWWKGWKKRGFLSSSSPAILLSPAPQSLTLITKGKLGWRLICLLGWIFFPDGNGAVRAALVWWVCEGEVSRF